MPAGPIVMHPASIERMFDPCKLIPHGGGTSCACAASTERRLKAGRLRRPLMVRPAGSRFLP
jgi:hypothetical protein